MTQAAQEPRTTPAGSSSPTSPSPSPTPLRPPPLGVKPPTPSTTETSDQVSNDGATGAGARPPSDPLDSPTSGTPSDSDRAGGAEPLNLGRDELRDTARGLVLAGALGLHHFLARYEVEQALGLWAMEDEREAAGIADPLARIARRYSGGALVDATTSDLIKAGLAAAGYVAKNGVQAIRVRLSIRRARRAGLQTNDDNNNPQE